jgi:hypothetical protein
MRARHASWVLLALVLAGCGLIPSVQEVPEGVAVPEPVPFVSECEPPLAFEGETTIAELGLVDAIPHMTDEDATRRGLIKITRNTVAWEQFAPPEVPPVVPAGQMLCLTFDDGTGSLATLLHRPFVGFGAEAPAERLELPLAPILVALVILLAVAVSWLAFRQRSLSDR